MKVYLFCEISADGTKRVVSVYDDPITEVDINMQVYELTDDKDISHLVVYILKNFDFWSHEKTLGKLSEKVMEKIRIYEEEHNIEDLQQIEFYNKLRNQNYMDGVMYPRKYEDVMDTGEIITTAYSVNIVTKKTLLKFLLSDTELFSFRLESCATQAVC